MLYSVSTLFYILAPALLLQYGLTLYCLVRLVFLDLPKKQFWIWNFFILLVPVAGVATFLVCYHGFRKKVFAKAGIFAAIPKAAGESVTHRMRLGSEPFGMLKNGGKTVEVRLFDEKRRKLQSGDIIEFFLLPAETESIKAAVKNIKVYESFEQLYINTPFTAFGRADKTLKQLLDATYEIYSKEDEKRFGAVAIDIEPIL